MSSKINIILIVAIILILGGIIVMAIKVINTKDVEDTVVVPSVSVGQNQSSEKFEPALIVNKGKESEERDALLEADIQKINTAILAYAEDNGGRYPVSDFKNPCSGVRFCLKGVDINDTDAIYLNPIPQTKQYNLDYHYRADNQEGKYCIKTGFVLETANTMVYQCTHDGCVRVLFKDSCR